MSTDAGIRANRLFIRGRWLTVGIVAAAASICWAVRATHAEPQTPAGCKVVSTRHTDGRHETSVSGASTSPSHKAADPIDPRADIDLPGASCFGPGQQARLQLS